jgi:membrane protease YdiL (CAAX protease family)
MIGRFPVGMILQHLLVFFLIVVTPLWDRYEIPRLKASTEVRKKIHFYEKIMTASWISALVAGLTIGLAAVTMQRTPGEIAWLDAGSRGAIFMKGMIGGVFLVIFVPALLALGSAKIRDKAGRAAKRLAFLVPSTREERRWWWLVCITAGVCEEIVYRGFLLHYLHATPFHLSLTWALVVSSVIFGIGHLYQGIAGAVSTVVIGFLLGAMYLMTGNLLLPIVVHAVMDLRVLAMLREGFGTAG